MTREISIFSLTRAKILSVLKYNEPIKIEDLVSKTDLGRSTVHHHLAILKKRKLILEKRPKEHGSPVYISINKTNQNSINKIEMFENVFPNQFKK